MDRHQHSAVTRNVHDGDYQIRYTEDQHSAHDVRHIIADDVSRADGLTQRHFVSTQDDRDAT